MDGQTVDLLVVGGGINGVGVARDAAGRGLSVMLVEKDDLAAHTSSASSKLIHGGLRYLEQLDFKLVRESLAERERLLRAAPHIVRPLRFIIPPSDLSRSAWKLRAGLFLYDHLGGRSQLPKSHAVSLEECGFGAGLKTSAAKAYSYWDACVDDSRLVVLNAIDAAERGAIIRTRTELVGARRETGNWSAKVRSSGGEERVRARAIVNATGPWAKQLFDRLPGARSCNGLRLVKGSHIVLPRLHSGGHALLLQNPDGRVVFAIPFELDFTLVGTTDIAWTGAPDQVAISEAEIDYLLATVAHYFSAAPAREEIVWSYSGVRALVDDGASNLAKVTRDYALELEAPPRQAPLLSVFGGKITTYRHLAERALDRLAPLLSAGKPWTRSGTLPGGEISSVAAFRDELARQHAWAPLALIERFARSYGSRAERILTGVHSLADLGEHFGGGLHAREVEYLIAEEWARTAEDVLFRRSKLGLRLGECGVRRVAAYLAR